MPKSGTADIQFCEENLRNQQTEIEHFGDNTTSILFENGKRIEFDEIGTIRYSVEINQLDKDRLASEFSCAISRISEVMKTQGSHNICLIINGNDIIETYIANSESITDFGESELGFAESQYSEINDNTIKISFRGHNFENLVTG